MMRVYILNAQAWLYAATAALTANGYLAKRLPACCGIVQKLRLLETNDYYVILLYES
jgi:hypothetical protein